MPSVLRIGPRTAQGGSTDLCIASRLRSAILSHFAEIDCETKSSDGGDGGNVMTISNKYFSAEVALEFLSDDERGGALGNEDGVVLVFDARGGAPSSICGAPTDPSLSFDSLTSVHDSAVSSKQAGDLLRLCVGVGLDGPLPPPSSKAAEEEYSRRVLWCLDRGYEYVEADLSDDGLRAGHDERDKEGFARVAEAVGGTVWSGATMKPRKAAQLRRTFEDAERGLRQPSSSSQAEVSKNPTPTAGKKKDSEEKKEISPKCNEDTSSKGVLKAAEKGREGAEIQKKAEEVLRLDPPQSFDEEDPGDSSAFSDLDNVLQQAAAVRAASKSGVLSDEERRKRAGDVAMMLAGLMCDSDDEVDERT